MNDNAIEKAWFAGGCFWCMQPPFDNTVGVVKTTVGYMGGHLSNPTYQEVCSDKTGHVEAIEVAFDPAIVRYEQLLAIFWSNIDPFDEGGSFADRGEHYHTIIFYGDESQRRAAEKSKAEIEIRFLGKPVATRLVPAKPFYTAEDYHQDYYQKNTVHYNLYKHASGRVSKLKEIWEK
ncbi:MAG: peptide-methionine (S)-S-oxide reductase MsrA [Alphaproteobacteria bacterium]|nr:peptide-methionine (S)-S-oxide reductase MsrA [Alphaproteobacteria bacterium]